VAVSIEGLPEMPIAGLRIEDLIATGKQGLQAFNTASMELRNVRMNVEEGVPFLIRDSKYLDLDGVESRNPRAGVPVVRLDNCAGALVRNSRAWAGTGAFLSVQPGAGKTLVQQGNYLVPAKTPLEESADDHWKSIKSPDRPAKR
jgi:hypothetical protein